MVVRENFDNKLQELEEKMKAMSNLAISSLEMSFEAFKTKDVELALKVIEEDEVVDDLEIEINHFIIWLMAKEQPVARDLRRIIGALKISSEIERIADFGVNIAKSTIKIGNSNSLVEITSLEKMKDISITMLQKGLLSFLNGDITIAKEVGELDDEVDKYSGELYKTITSYLKEHPEETDHLVQLLLINRYLERTADHITNIAESAAYLIKGQMYDLNS
ncbi:phosphate signaling complex protein PhoU [Fredinandcohnia quinoae]|uniref:Phosphate-specific transport system accessory protein PhoU n=1 Tax=Fredinandcohnia quinoae TaxID=2918902 RepID=A0AAW5DUA6_9BACI|nr:phosphate signaling complex protein PhoU [Fredinandcohnia sp. SECRCQ15]MCH1624211.1 phosphate signaling complex protein PhoU [Fredinandcohnia sp. SECRCQ15]